MSSCSICLKVSTLTNPIYPTTFKKDRKNRLLCLDCGEKALDDMNPYTKKDWIKNILKRNTYNPNVHCDKCRTYTGHNINDRLLCVYCYLYYLDEMNDRQKEYMKSQRKISDALNIR